jgi:hypothetical protein
LFVRTLTKREEWIEKLFLKGTHQDSQQQHYKQQFRSSQESNKDTNKQEDQEAAQSRVDTKYEPMSHPKTTPGHKKQQDKTTNALKCDQDTPPIDNTKRQH